jgi:hypothetical protein
MLHDFRLVTNKQAKIATSTVSHDKLDGEPIMLRHWLAVSTQGNHQA